MKSRRRRPIEIFNLSFLDVVSCGFGAIILLLVIVKVAEPFVLERSHTDLSGLVRELEVQLREIRGEREILNRDLEARREQLSEVMEKLARLQGEMSSIEGRYAASRLELEAQTTIESQMALARQRLSQEQKRLLRSTYRRSSQDATIGGVPVDSEYIIFIIDTSGSMREGHPGTQRHGGVHVFPVQGPLDNGYAGQAQGYSEKAPGLGAVQQLKSGGGDRSRDPPILRTGQKNQPVYLW